MAASNDNQGLKITVAVLVMLVFILGVTNYFAFSAASQNEKLKDAEVAKRNKADSDVRDMLSNLNWARTQLGYGSIEDVDVVKTNVKKENDAIDAEILGITSESNNAITEVQRSGQPDPKLDELRQVFAGIADQFVREPSDNKNAVSRIRRLKDLLVNQSRVMRELSFDYLKLRAELTSANSINAMEVAKANEGLAKAVREKQAAIEQIAAELKNLNDQVANLQNSDKEKTNKIVDLGNQLTDVNGRFDTFKTDASRVITDLKDRLYQKETELGKAIGKVTLVDYSRGEVRVSVNKYTGAKPLMKFTVFDADARGVPTDKPKGVVEILAVGDPAAGETDSLARIVQTKDSTDPIRRYDQIYSPTFTPDFPQRFGLVGKIDVNRDGKDDRADLIRMIEDSGGLVEYDLPPPGVDRTPGRLAVERACKSLGVPVPPPAGRASGKISPYARAYIIDDTAPLRGSAIKDDPMTPEYEAFNKEFAAAVKDARSNGVPPMQLARLLTQLGYTRPVGGFFPGQVEYRNREATKRIIRATPPKPGQAAPADGGAATPTPPATPPADGTVPPTEKPGDPK